MLNTLKSSIKSIAVCLSLTLICASSLAKIELNEVQKNYLSLLMLLKSPVSDARKVNEIQIFHNRLERDLKDYLDEADGNEEKLGEKALQVANIISEVVIPLSKLRTRDGKMSANSCRKALKSVYQVYSDNTEAPINLELNSAELAELARLNLDPKNLPISGTEQKNLINNLCRR